MSRQNTYEKLTNTVVTRRTWLRYMVLSSAAVGLLGACGGSDDDPVGDIPSDADATSTSFNEAEATSTPVNEAEATDAPEPTAASSPEADTSPTSTTVEGALTDEIRIAISGDTDNLNPHVTSTEIHGDSFARLVFDYLVDMDEESLETVPLLAERWEVSDDATTYTFYLRQNATFHNGRPLTAQDVAFSFEYANSEGFWTVSLVAPISEVEVPDDYTVRVRLIEPHAYFPSNTYSIAIVPEEAVDDLATDPIGSGPFRFVEHVRNDHWTLERFADYWDPGVAKTERLVMRILPDASAAIQNLRSGDVHVVRDVAFSDTQQFDGQDEIQVIASPPGAVSHIFHMTGKNNEAILTNKQVRQALAWAMNREAMNEIGYGGTAMITGSPLSPSLPTYYDPDLYTYDPARARELLEAAGVTDLEFTIVVQGGGSVSEQFATIWQQGLLEAGVTANIQVDEAAVWLEKYLAQDYDVMWNQFPPTADPTRFFTLIIGRFVRAEVFTAENGYTEELYTELLPEARGETDPDESNAILQQMQELIADELPIIPAIASPAYSLTQLNVAGWIALPSGLRKMSGIHLEE